jgi:hypothetical protein
MRIAPVQRVIAAPITDPAEQVAIDRLRKRKKRKQSGQSARHSASMVSTSLRVTARSGPASAARYRFVGTLSPWCFRARFRDKGFAKANRLREDCRDGIRVILFG